MTEHMENENRNEDVNNYINVFKKISYEINLDIRMKLAILKWLKYKSERGQSYKPSGMKSMINKLIKLSDSDSKKADLIIEQSMSNNWAGIFELKNNEKNRTTNKKGFASDTSKAAVNGAIDLLRGSEQ